MRVLGIDTATATASVGLVDADGRTIEERSRGAIRSHAVEILPMVQETLAAAGVQLGDLAAVAISIGPGSFTGVRVGLSIAKGLALAEGLPVVGVPTLEALVVAGGQRANVLWPLLDARKGEVYAAAYRWRGAAVECVREAMVISPAHLVDYVEPPCTFVGEGVGRYGDELRRRFGNAVALASSVVSSGAVVARLGALRWAQGKVDNTAELQPTYVRCAEAERQRGAGSRGETGALSA